MAQVEAGNDLVGGGLEAVAGVSDEKVTAVEDDGQHDRYQAQEGPRERASVVGDGQTQLESMVKISFLK